MDLITEFGMNKVLSHGPWVEYNDFNNNGEISSSGVFVNRTF